MNILMFNYEYPPLGGGGGVIHQHIAEELARRHQVTVLTSGSKGLPPFEKSNGVDIHRVRVLGRNSQATASLPSMLSYFPASIKAGQRLVDSLRPDLINTHFAVPTGPSAVIVARRNRIPHALCIHGGDIYDPSKRLSPHRTPGLRHTVRWVLRNVDLVLAQSANTADNATRIYGCNGPVTVIPHGLKEPSLPPRSRPALGITEEQIVLVTIGRLIARKSNDQLIAMLAQLGDPRLLLVILGDGPQKASLYKLACDLGVENQLRMPGFVNETLKYQYLQAADVFVSTTSHEGFGLMYIEAMFCGLPIVTYDHGGQKDFLQDGKTGYLVPLNDQDLFARRTASLTQAPGLRRTMGAYNRDYSGQFTITRCAARYEEVFHGMLHQGSLPLQRAAAAMAGS